MFLERQLEQTAQLRSLQESVAQLVSQQRAMPPVVPFVPSGVEEEDEPDDDVSPTPSEVDALYDEIIPPHERHLYELVEEDDE